MAGLDMKTMEAILKKVYLPAVKEKLNENLFAAWANIGKSPETWTIKAAPAVVTEFEIQWDAPLQMDSRPAHVPMGLHVVEVKWVEFDGQMLRRVPSMDAYEVMLVMHVVLIPNKAGMDWNTIQSILTNQACDAAKMAFRKAPPPWKNQPIQNAWEYPSTNFYSQRIISGPMWAEAAQSPSKKADLIHDVAENAYKQLLAFLAPRVMAGAAYDWMHDKEVKIMLPVTYTKEEPDALSGLSLS